MLAIHAELAGARLALNELAGPRADLLSLLFAGSPATRHDGASIDDRLDPAVRPNVVLMNPPFSAVANVGRTMRDAALRHIGSRSEEHTSELQSLMRISYAVFCLKKNKTNTTKTYPINH